VIPRTFRLPILLAGALLVQTAIVPQVAYRGRVVDIMLLVAVSAGLVGGPDRGAVVGFLAGAGTDLVVQTPFGMWALVGAVTGWTVGSVYGSYIVGGRVMRLVTIGTALASGTAGYVVLGRLIGQSFLADVSLLPVVLTVSIGGMLLSPLAMRSVAWTFAMTQMPWDDSR
jgi:rod shape-determining protein MreD